MKRGIKINKKNDNENDDLLPIVLIIGVIVMTLIITIVFGIGKEVKSNLIGNVSVQNINKEQRTIGGDGETTIDYYVGFTYLKKYYRIECIKCYRSFEADNEVEIRVYDSTTEKFGNNREWYKFMCEHNKECFGEMNE